MSPPKYISAWYYSATAHAINELYIFQVSEHISLPCKMNQYYVVENDLFYRPAYVNDFFYVNSFPTYFYYSCV